jgi:putative transposase
MASMHGKSGKRKKRKRIGKAEVLTRDQYESLGLDTRIALIQQLIPIGLMAVAEELEREVMQLAGGRYERRSGDGENDAYRHGSNPGSVKLMGQRVGVSVPRVRSQDGEIPLQSYQLLHRGKELDEELFRRVLYGISCRNYEAASVAIPEAIGVSKSTVSRQFIAASSKELKAFQERDLSGVDIVAIFLDGKSFAEDEMVIALGVTMEGEKVFLGFVQTDTENSRVLSAFLSSMLDRGLDISKGVLAVIDGAKGLASAVKGVFKKRALIQRCQWHKRENVVSYLSKSEQKWMRTRLQKAYERPTYEEAKKALKEIRKELESRNQSAMSSLDEGFEETLTLHRLCVFALLGQSFKTTNCIESINAQAEERCAKVDRWKNSNQKHRWLAAALMDIEPRLRKVRGYRHLHLLRTALMKELNLDIQDKVA